jgi:deoxyribodipyrimidine photo-lyase
MNKNRVTVHSSGSAKPGPIVYWMNREIRAEDNWALVHACEVAAERKTDVVVIYNLAINFLGGGLRQWDFKIQALKEVASKLEEVGIPFYLLVDEDGKKTGELLEGFIQTHRAAGVVVDFSPLKEQRVWVADVAKRSNKSALNERLFFHEVDAHNIVPVWIASPKQEYGAYTLRPKLHKLLPEYLDEFPTLKKCASKLVFSRRRVPEIYWDKLLADERVAKNPQPVTWCKPGEQAAHKALHHFITHRLPHYASHRNDPNEKAQSDLSPYLHYGMIAPQRIALEVVKTVGQPIEVIMHELKNKAKVEAGHEPQLIDHAAAFLEELIVTKRTF